LQVSWERFDLGEEAPAVSLEPEVPAEETFFPPAAFPERDREALPVPDRLSYSDLALYRECGLRFQAEKVLRVGRLSDVAAPGDSRAFGSAVHAALQLAVEGTRPDEPRLASLARLHRLAADDVRRLAEVVDAYLASPLAGDVAAQESVRTEAPFVVPLGSGPAFLLRGTIDVYARSGPVGLVVDYKTGTSGMEAELRPRFALQASCYALVALRDGCERVRVVFVRPEVAGANGPQLVEYDFAMGDGGRIADGLLAEHGRMAAGEYPPLEKWRRDVCGECPIAGTLCTVERG
jgi:hypothetical protein